MRFIQLLLCFLGTAVALQINEGCMSGSTKTAQIVGNELLATVWVPDDSDDTPLLSITSENELTSAQREITITKSQAVVQEVYKGRYTRRHFNLSEASIPFHWAEFRIDYGRRFRVAAENETLVEVDDYVESRSVVLRGSNVTINCRERIIVWTMPSDHSVLLPIVLPSANTFTLFPMTPSTPVLEFGTLALRLSWDTKRRVVTAGDLAPVPPFRQYDVTIECHVRGERCFCTIQVGDEVIASTLLPGVASSVAMRASENEDIIVLTTLKEVSPNRGLNHTPKMQMGDNQSLDAGDGQPFAKTKLFYFLLALLGGIVLTIIYFVRRRKREYFV